MQIEMLKKGGYAKDGFIHVGYEPKDRFTVGADISPELAEMLVREKEAKYVKENVVNRPVSINEGEPKRKFSTAKKVVEGSPENKTLEG